MSGTVEGAGARVGKKVLLVGATGGTGLEVIRQASGRGVEVTVLLRSPDKLGDLVDQAVVITGDVFDANQVAQAAEGCDTGICAIGAAAGFLGRGATQVYSQAAAALVTALPRAGVNRLVFCTSAGVEPHDPGEVLPYRLIAKPLFLQRAYNDMAAAEMIIRRSTLDWTIVRPGRLINSTDPQPYRTSPRFRPVGGTGISRTNVASSYSISSPTTPGPARPRPWPPDSGLSHTRSRRPSDPVVPCRWVAGMQ